MQDPCSEKSNMEAFKKYSACCAITNLIRRYPKQALIVMKYGIQSPNLIQSEIEHQTDFGNISKSFPEYELLVNDKNRINTRTYNPRILMCQLDSERNDMNPENCDIFKRVFTNHGIGYAFNHRKFQDGINTSMANTFYEDLLFPSKYEIGKSLTDGW